jgi:hypothetical protein
MAHIRRRMLEGDPKVNCFHEDAEGTLWFKDRLVVLKKETLKKMILDEAHTSKYSIHPGSIKMYQDLREQLWQTRMKHETAHYVSECETCKKVKANYMKSRGLLQHLSIPDWKWDNISMDFIVGLPLMTHKFDSIWVIVDQHTKSTHFILVHTNCNAEKYAGIYIARVLCLHRVRKMIMSDRGSQFVAHFWEQLHASLRTHFIHSSSYHPQMDGQTERVNQILEEACVMEHQGSWDHLKPCMDIIVAPHSTGSSQERRSSLVQISSTRLKRWSVVSKTT